MPISQLQLLESTCPFDVYIDEQPEMVQTVRGFGKDPVGTRKDCVYFSHGGWLTLSHLMRHYSMATTEIKP